MIDTYSGLLNWGIYLWIGIALIVGIGLTLFIKWAKESNIKIKWYEWLSVFVGIVLLAFTIQNFYGAFQEKVVKAAFMFLLLPGVPALILLVLPLVRVTMARNKA
jgi:hypothetical protein